MIIIIKKYNIELLEKIKQSVYYKDGKPKILTVEYAIKVINEISDLNIEQVKKEVLVDEEKWKKYKNI